MTRADETQELWLDYRRTRDQRIRDRLIRTYVPLVKYVAGRLSSSLPAHIEVADIVSCGLSGLVSAIERYDPVHDEKFEKYAMARIKRQILDELRSTHDRLDKNQIRGELRSRDWRPDSPDEPEGGGGVREPRRPRSSGLSDATALPAPESDEDA